MCGATERLQASGMGIRIENGRCELRSKIFPILLITGLLVVGVGQARADGAVRIAGKAIATGTTAAASATAEGAPAAGSGVASGGEATGGALKTAATSTGKAVAATPNLTVQGVKGAGSGMKAAGKGILKALW